MQSMIVIKYKKFIVQKIQYKKIYKFTDTYDFCTISNFYAEEDCLISKNPLLSIYFPKFITPNNDV